jgi:hypothetical protein
MENRRQNYRHAFAPDALLPVSIQRGTGGPFWKGWALDLSVTGTRVRLEDSAQHLAANDRVVLRMALPRQSERLQMHGMVIHYSLDEQHETYGIEFLPSLSSSADELRERLIWTFLLQEQRRVIKQRHATTES